VPRPCRAACPHPPHAALPSLLAHAGVCAARDGLDGDDVQGRGGDDDGRAERDVEERGVEGHVQGQRRQLPQGGAEPRHAVPRLRVHEEEDRRGHLLLRRRGRAAECLHAPLRRRRRGHGGGDAGLPAGGDQDHPHRVPRPVHGHWRGGGGHLQDRRRRARAVRRPAPDARGDVPCAAPPAATRHTLVQAHASRPAPPPGSQRRATSRRPTHVPARASAHSFSSAWGACVAQRTSASSSWCTRL
jgi:hypothetical protein